MPVHETEFHGGCTVVVGEPDENWLYSYCGEKVYGSRGDWLMCRFHYEIFALEEPDCIEQPTVPSVVFISIIALIVLIVALLVFAAWQGASADPSTHLR